MDIEYGRYLGKADTQGISTSCAPMHHVAYEGGWRGSPRSNHTSPHP